MKTRIEGIVLLLLCTFVVHRISALVHQVPLHQPTPGELTLGLVAVVTGMLGAAMLTVGPALFQTYVWPPRERD